MIARILIIAGSDSGGGAGIQADIKTVTALGGFAMTAITAVTVQNTVSVAAVHEIPGSIIALLGATACVGLLGIPVETIGSRFGGIPQGFPPLTIPDFDLATLRHLIAPAITIATAAIAARCRA